MSTAAISLCIPRVFNNITEAKVYNVFNKLNIGKIHSINMIERTNKKGKLVKRVFINFDYWYLNERSQMRNQLLSGKEIKIVYDDPWFWNVSIKRNTNNKPLAPTTNIAPGLINIASTNIAPGLPKIYKELEDNPNIYADDKKLMERMKPINYSLMHIPAPKKMKLKIRK